jgi:DNA-binding IscR family transcriptional regulator
VSPAKHSNGAQDDSGSHGVCPFAGSWLGSGKEDLFGFTTNKLVTIAEVAGAYQISSNHLMTVVHHLALSGDVVTKPKCALIGAVNEALRAFMTVLDRYTVSPVYRGLPPLMERDRESSSDSERSKPH